MTIPAHIMSSWRLEFDIAITKRELPLVVSFACYQARTRSKRCWQRTVAFFFNPQGRRTDVGASIGKCCRILSGRGSEGWCPVVCGGVFCLSIHMSIHTFKAPRPGLEAPWPGLQASRPLCQASRSLRPGLKASGEGLNDPGLGLHVSKLQGAWANSPGPGAFSQASKPLGQTPLGPSGP